MDPLAIPDITSILSMDMDNIGAITLSYVDVAINFGLVVLGVVLHFLKKCKVDEIPFKSYWISNKKASIMSIVAALVGFLILVKLSQNSPLVYLAVGYMCDSILNRIDSVLDKNNQKNE